MLQHLLFSVALTLSLSSFSRVRAHDVQVAPNNGVQIIEGGRTTTATQREPELHVHAEPISDAPSVWGQSMQGFLSGSLIGLSVAYLFVRDGRDDAWRDLLLGSGIGALSGAGLGFTVGLLNAADDRPGDLRYVTRDMLYGTGVGALVGGVAGGLVALKSTDANDILLGSAVGVISGGVLGILAGVIEGQWRKPSRQARVRASLTLSQSGLAPKTALRGFVPTLVGTF